MDMWCPYGIGREIWDRVMRMLIDQDPSPLKGEISLAGVFPFAGVGGAARTRVIVVVEYIIILIIIIVVLLDFGQLQFCQTVHLESLLFFKPLVFARKVMSRQIGSFCCWHVFLWSAG